MLPVHCREVSETVRPFKIQNFHFSASVTSTCPSPMQRTSPLAALLLLLVFTHIHPASCKALVCLRGTFLDGTRCSLCPGGTFGNRPGLITPQCSGSCAPGHYCPPGSTSATEKPCGTSTFYCPRGSAMRQRVDQGFYTVTYPFPDGTATATNHADRQTQCEPGFFCINGIRRKCPVGSYGISSGLTAATCSGPCPKGFYCPEGTSDPLPCPAGTFGGELGLTTAACSGLCPIGFYCLQATITPRPCPAGAFGGTEGLTTKQCSAKCSESTCVSSPCPAGFYCPLATTTLTPCGDVSVFCPLGSSSPTTVSTGFYTIWKTVVSVDAYIEGAALASLNQTTRIDQRVCERGTYCIGGVKRKCPPGTYGDVQGLATAQCSGPCPPGFYCPVGTASYYRYPCTERTAFCRQGSSTPSVVLAGYYTITVATGDVRVDQQICPPGSYCLGGIKYLCPAGTFGSTSGLSSSACSGRCQDGYTCATGSVSATATPCAAGQYSRNGVSCAPCLPGFWCSAGSPDPMQNACGSDSAYCPLGSSSPTNVAAGYYAVGQTPNSHTSQAQCGIQTVKHLQQCPTRTIGTNSGL